MTKYNNCMWTGLDFKQNIDQKTINELLDHNLWVDMYEYNSELKKSFKRNNLSFYMPLDKILNCKPLGLVMSIL